MEDTVDTFAANLREIFLQLLASFSLKFCGLHLSSGLRPVRRAGLC